MRKTSGFTLLEVQVALLLLGTIATFAIPKVLHNISSVQNNAIMKETFGALSGALMLYKHEQGAVDILVLVCLIWHNISIM